MLHKKDGSARVILGNQSWIKIQEFSILDNTNVVVRKIDPYPTDREVNIGDQVINLPTVSGKLQGTLGAAQIFNLDSDARHLCAIWEAIGEYQLNRDVDHYEPEVFTSFLILIAVKLHYRDVLEKVWKNGRGAGSGSSAPAGSFNANLWQAAEDVASSPKYIQGWSPAPKTLFVWAANNDYHSVTTALLSQIGIITTQKDVRWWYSLRNVVGTGNMKAGMLFLFRGRWGVDELDRGELQMAASCGHEAMVDALLVAGANVNTHGLLNAAVQGGHDAMVDRLLMAGARINSNVLGGGDTVLETAAEEGNRSMVNKLLKAGANVQAPGVLCGAFIGGDEAIIETLLTAGAKIHSGLLTEVVQRGYGAAVDRVLKAGADINSPRGLETAILIGDTTIVELLIKAGAHVDHGSVLFAEQIGRSQKMIDILRIAAAM